MKKNKDDRAMKTVIESLESAKTMLETGIKTQNKIKLEEQAFQINLQCV